MSENKFAEMFKNVPPLVCISGEEAVKIIHENYLSYISTLPEFNSNEKVRNIELSLGAKLVEDQYMATDNLKIRDRLRTILIDINIAAKFMENRI